MGELIPWLAIGFLVLAALVAVIAKATVGRKLVTKPLSQEDMVERIKIRMTAEDAEAFAQEVVTAAKNAKEKHIDVAVERYEKATGRLIHFDVDWR